MQSDIRRIPVEISALRAWSVIVGAGLVDQLAELFDFTPYSAIALITDSATRRLFGERVSAALNKTGKQVRVFSVPRGERSKSLVDAQRGYRFLMESNFDRRALICILGGGVVGDLGGYIAATYLRGIDYIQLPTTLLAQVDSSLGGKVGVNFGGKKNIIGSFYQPRFIISDVEFLEFLPGREMRNGLAEVMKYGLAMDAQLFQRLSRRPDEKFTQRELIDIVERCSSLKLKVVQSDETERSGERMILNFGHTLGHAIEVAKGLEGRHGEAVAVGMAGAARISERLGMITDDDVLQIEDLLRRYGLPVRSPGTNPETVLEGMRFDKKVRDGEVCWVLLERIGHGVVNRRVEENLVREVLREMCR